ncbi:hypothetical protein [Streptomyces sp. NPDC048277]
MRIEHLVGRARHSASAEPFPSVVTDPASGRPPDVVAVLLAPPP